jgi:hypothetical protein
MNVASPFRTPRRTLILASLGLLVLLACAFALGRHTVRRGATTPVTNTDAASATAASAGTAITTVYAHNILLRQGTSFRAYIRWIRGQMLRTRHDVDPSFDDPNSFVLLINKGVIIVHLQDIVNFLNSGSTNNTPLKKVSIQASGNEIEIHGTVHKLIPLPVKLKGELSPLPDGRVRFHVASYSLLKVPMKGFLHLFDVKLADLAPSAGVPGVQITGNDILFDTQQLLPPPHIHGQITTIRTSPQDLTLIYGASADDEGTLAQWHNFLRFTGGNLDFGKLTMHNADVTMIDASNDPWFDLDLTNYQAQLVNGYTRMTAQAALEIFMPNLDAMHTKPVDNQGITLEWLKNRNASLPAAVSKAIQSK